ncbi:MAG: methylase involved in ubiquinone/menaquinone biosynthesis [Candidatus Nanosalina sp. J07AB43]|nr:MAG: methylase involved in ubiquinone/menaquinone biosynthesis [Candidatus Nanosalina sp. J07AB43]
MSEDSEKPVNVQDQGERAEQIARFIEEETDKHPHIDEFVERVSESGKVLDLGCGHGKHVDYLVQNGLEAVGVDLAEGMLHEKERRGKKGTYIEQDFRNLPEHQFDDDEYDALWANAALKFYPEQEMRETIEEWSRVLRPGGEFYTSFKIKGGQEDYDWLQTDEDGNEFVQRDGEDYPRYLLDSVEDAEQILEEHGYEPQQAYVSDDHTDYDIQVVNIFASKE